MTSSSALDNEPDPSEESGDVSGSKITVMFPCGRLKIATGRVKKYFERAVENCEAGNRKKGMF